MVSEEVLKFTIRLKMHTFYSDLYRSRGIRRIFCWPNTDVPVDLDKKIKDQLHSRRVYDHSIISDDFYIHCNFLSCMYIYDAL